MNFEDNYLTKQSYLCLAASLRANGFPKVGILDCMPLQMGWRSLAIRLATIRPDIVAIGENHALYAHEAVRAFSLAKEVLPGVVTVAGGAHFTNLADTYLGHPSTSRCASPPPWLAAEPGNIDYVIKGEGDITLVELVKHLSGSDGPPVEVPGLAFVNEGTVVHTAVRPLVEDLDHLPLPAYDLVPMDLYGQAKLLFSPGGTSIYHSRGCVHSCSFCVWWTQMARRELEPGTGRELLRPAWRTKSVERTLEEVKLLVNRYGKRGLVFVDDCWNLDPRWNEQFARAILDARIKVNWFAFMRADYLIRDHELGILDLMVRAGLSHVSIGAERVEDSQLSAFGKKHYSAESTRKAFGLLKRHYPSVFRQATFIVGVPDETRESMLRQLDFALELDLDYPGFHPLTPVPGTRLWDQAIADGAIEADSFLQFDWATPVVPSIHMSRHEIEATLIEIEKRYVRLPWLIRGLTSRDRYKRAMYQWFLKVSLRMSADLVKHTLRPSAGPIMPMLKPKWYDK